MFPVAIDLSILPLILVGNGQKTLRRLKLLEECGAAYIRLFADQPDAALVAAAGERLVRRLPVLEDYATARAVMIVDIAEEQAIQLATLARQQHILVNVEDNKPYCDFHFPSFVKRGDLLLAVSTGGKSPTLSRTIRRLLATMFDESWAGKLEQLAAKRQAWQQEGVSYDDIARKSEAWIQAEAGLGT
jgi:precorrin-2 dehydrogenase/sirohydrochlorin ferrochelatase